MFEPESQVIVCPICNRNMAFAKTEFILRYRNGEISNTLTLDHCMACAFALSENMDDFLMTLLGAHERRLREKAEQIMRDVENMETQSR